ncbi:hypothetical protein BC828DRAFT_383013, partial [Blastocladiella britannica]
MSWFIKKLTGSKDNLAATKATPSSSSSSAAQDTLASLGLDPSLLADDPDDDPAAADALAHDPALAADLLAVQSGAMQARKPAAAAKPPARTAAAAAAAGAAQQQSPAATSELDLDAIHRDLLGDGDLDSDAEVEIEAHEVGDLEAQLAELAGLTVDELNELAEISEGMSPPEATSSGRDGSG